MDSETGERKRDCETGELMPYEPEYDSETGEPNTFHFKIYPKRTPFKIPSTYTNKTEKVYLPTNNARDMSPVLLILLPTLFFYPGLISIIIALVEVIIHTWAHKKNKEIANKNIYYKSPMHIIASEFCAQCRDIKTMDKIEKLQEKRAHRFKYHYEYVKRIVT